MKCYIYYQPAVEGVWDVWQATWVGDLDSGVQRQNPDSRLWLGLGKASTFVKVKERSWFQLNVDKHNVPQVTVDFFCFKPDPDLSLTLTTCYHCQNFIRRFNKAVAPLSDTVFQTGYFARKQMKYVAGKHFTYQLSINSFLTFQSLITNISSSFLYKM